MLEGSLRSPVVIRPGIQLVQIGAGGWRMVGEGILRNRIERSEFKMFEHLEELLLDV
jgi:hypothetical protein